eukprot:3897534-Ditylum_brightwellii.AAC.1
MKLLKEYNIDIFGFAETNLTWSKSLEHTAKYHGQKVFQHFSLITCSSNNPTSASHQPGGVSMGVTGAMTGSNGLQIRIMSAYRVCQDK